MSLSTTMYSTMPMQQQPVMQFLQLCEVWDNRSLINWHQVTEQYQGADVLAWATASNWGRVIDWFGICSIISTGVVKLDTYAKTITFPSSTVLVWRGRYYRLSESHQLSVSIDSGGDDAKLYFNA